MSIRCFKELNNLVDFFVDVLKPSFVQFQIDTKWSSDKPKKKGDKTHQSQIIIVNPKNGCTGEIGWT